MILIIGILSLMNYLDIFWIGSEPDGTILILRNQKDWVGGVSKMIMLYVKWAQFTSDDWLQAGWVGYKKVKILIT